MFLALTLTILIAATSQPPSPRSGTREDQQPTQQTQKDDPKSNQAERGTDMNPLVVRTVRTQAQADAEQNESGNQMANRRYTLLLAFATLAVLVVQAWLFINQNKIMDRQTEIMVAGQRAWLTMTGFEFAPLGKAGIPLAKIEIRNSGHQPGTITSHTSLLFTDGELPRKATKKKKDHGLPW